MQEQLTALTQKMNEYFDQISRVKWEINVMKEKAKSYQNAIGDVTPGRITVPALKTQLQLGIQDRGFLESMATTADGRVLEDVAAIDNLFKIMDIEDKKLTKISRIWKYDTERETRRTILFLLDSNLTKSIDFKIHAQA